MPRDPVEVENLAAAVTLVSAVLAKKTSVILYKEAAPGMVDTLSIVDETVGLIVVMDTPATTAQFVAAFPAAMKVVSFS